MASVNVDLESIDVLLRGHAEESTHLDNTEITDDDGTVPLYLQLRIDESLPDAPGTHDACPRERLRRCGDEHQACGESLTRRLAGEGGVSSLVSSPDVAAPGSMMPGVDPSSSDGVPPSGPLGGASPDGAGEASLN